MNFLDSYFKTGDKMRSKAARQEFYCAIVEYYYKGEEPDFKTEAAEIGWQGILYSLNKARAGRKGGQANAEQTANETPTAPRADPQANREANAEQTANETPTKEEEGKPNGLLEEEDPPYPPFALLCLKALNEELGRDFTTMPSKCSTVLERAEGRYGEDQVRAMVAFKRDEWAGTRFRGCLTPNTLFSPDHFEQYMAQAEAHAEEVGRYAEYA